MMLFKKSHFCISWSDLTYKIQSPESSYHGAWASFERKCRSNLVRLTKLVSCGKHDRYDFSYHEKKSENDVVILRQLNGSFKSGELTGILGPSGAGKTSLLNFLSRRKSEGYTGRLMVDDTIESLKISTIPQDVLLPDYLTVQENLLFASQLNNTNKSYWEHKQDCLKIAKALGLDGCLDLSTKKISGGQYKRLAIAQELLSKPSVLILDEPTSGLDSLSCYKTIKVLKDLTEASKENLINPIAIVLTIHQPQKDALELFDKIYVMASGGTAIYEGQPKLCSKHITTHTGIELPFPGYDSAAFAIDVASGKYGIEPIFKLGHQIERSVKVTGPSKLGRLLGFEMESVSSMDDLFVDKRIVRGPTISSGNCEFLKKTIILSSRYWKSIVRDKKLLPLILFCIGYPFWMYLIIGTEPGKTNACPKTRSQFNLSELVANDDHLTNRSVQDEVGATIENISSYYSNIYTLISFSIAFATLSFNTDLKTSLKEHFNGWYSMSSYLTARIVTDIPMTILCPTLCIVAFYYVTGQATGHNDLYRILITDLAFILGTMSGQLIGMIVGAIYLNHLATAMFMSQAVTMPMVFWSGFIVRTKYLGKALYALTFTSIYKHMNEVAVVARYGYNLCGCNQSAINFTEPDFVDVPKGLRDFTREMMTVVGETDGGTNETDLFKTIAKQVNLYNANGIDVKSCADVQPHQLHVLQINETTIPVNLISLVFTIIILVTTLFITMKLVIRLKSSL